jgi:hypothetical protein
MARYRSTIYLNPSLAHPKARVPKKLQALIDIARWASSLSKKASPWEGMALPYARIASIPPLTEPDERLEAELTNIGEE